ncbi:MAG: hypothetical protein HN392_06910 [Anaerolineae bacterium]|jgi:hypothetical protein|nr:hypothetical protein [Anaerolineae bacterium]MBT7073710.1 hypothetical protein [Anaerolineae bacterium]MBT7782899.1 hypothetical protein [Anaerolineae bacterium]
MNESTLLIVFIGFTLTLAIGAIIIRKISVEDIFDIEKPTLFAEGSPAFAEPTKKPVLLNAGQEKSSFKIGRKEINTIGKILGAVGGIILFAPLPDSYTNFALGLAFVGYMIIKATATPKKKQNP